MGAPIKAFERVRPGNIGTLPAATNPVPGTVFKFTFTSAASAEQVFRPNPSAEQFVSIKTTADVHVAFGPTAARAGGTPITDPTNAGFLLQPGDSWQDVQLNADDGAFKVKGDAGGGDFYLMISGR